MVKINYSRSVFLELFLENYSWGLPGHWNIYLRERPFFFPIPATAMNQGAVRVAMLNASKCTLNHLRIPPPTPQALIVSSLVQEISRFHPSPQPEALLGITQPDVRRFI